MESLADFMGKKVKEPFRVVRHPEVVKALDQLITCIKLNHIIIPKNDYEAMQIANVLLAGQYPKPNWFRVGSMLIWVLSVLRKEQEKQISEISTVLISVIKHHYIIGAKSSQAIEAGEAHTWESISVYLQELRTFLKNDTKDPRKYTQ